MPRTLGSEHGGYHDPLGSADVRPERIDQGVDYVPLAGYLVAIADGIVSQVHDTGSGWPGKYVSYTITQNGPLDGVTVYYAEGVNPTVKVGESIKGGQQVATLDPSWPTGIEVGYANSPGDTQTWAAAHGGYTAADSAADIPTRAGQAFSALIRALGGPPGDSRAQPVGEWPPWANAAISAAKGALIRPGSPIPTGFTTLTDPSAIVARDDYSGIVEGVWNILHRAFDVWWSTARQLHHKVQATTIITPAPPPRKRGR